MKEPSIHIPHAFYDYSKLIEAAKKESQYTDFSSFIAEKIREYRDKYYDGEALKSVLIPVLLPKSSTALSQPVSEI